MTPCRMKASQRRAMFAQLSRQRKENKSVVTHLQKDIREQNKSIYENKRGIVRDKKEIKKLKSFEETYGKKELNKVLNEQNKFYNVPTPTIKDIKQRYELKKTREKALMKQYPNLSVYGLKQKMYEKYNYSRDE